MRSFLVTVILAVILAGGAAYYFDLWDPQDPLKLPYFTAGDTAKTSTEHSAVDVGELLYGKAEVKEGAVPGGATNPVLPPTDIRPDPIVVPNCPLVVYKKQEVPAEREGQLIIVGEPQFSTDLKKPDQYKQAKIILGKAQEHIYEYVPWQENDLVDPGQIVAVINPALAIKEYNKNQNKLNIAEKEHEASLKIAAEMENKYNRLVRANSLGGRNTVSAEELAIAKLTWEAKIIESETKSEAIQLAKTELDMAKIVHEEHFLRSKLSGKGRIKQILKQQGEAVQKNETVLILEDIEHLRAEGRLEAQYLQRLRDNKIRGKKMLVSIEPRREQAPWRTLKAHKDEVTSLAVSQDDLILSASKDRTVLVWTLLHRSPTRMLEHPSEVLAVACTPKGAKLNYAVTGCADGSLRLWNLSDTSSQPLRELEEKHDDGITALAFSPDGRYFASGSHDNNIILWETATGKQLYVFDAEHGVTEPHQGTITALHFTPQSRLVSASRDGTLRVWELHVQGAHLLQNIAGRSSTVADLGVSQDGRWMLFDKGSVLQLLSIPDGKMVANLSNLTTSTAFDTLAEVSTDGQLILTAGAPEGRLQLWRTPMDDARSFEVTQLVTMERSPVTCAAFAHHSAQLRAEKDAGESFAVSGSKEGNVYIWSIPDRQTVEKYRIRNLRLNYIDEALESGRQGWIRVNLDNSSGQFIPGSTVTIVVEEE